MKRLLFLLFLAPFSNSCSVAQNKQLFTEESAKKHLTLLSSREFEGRGTGQLGGQKTANYIAEQFKNAGLKPMINGSYFQPVALIKTSYHVQQFQLGNKQLINGKDFFVQGDNDLQSFHAKEIVFVGYGIADDKYNELKNLDLKDKVVLLINENEPKNEQGHSLITGTSTESEWASSRFKRIQQIMKQAPKLILATGANAEKLIKQTNDRNLLGRFQLENLHTASKKGSKQKPVVYISQDIANGLLQLKKTSIQNFKDQSNKTFKPQTTHITINVNATMGIEEKKLNDPNVIGLVEGTDLKEEIVVVAGHYDHDGILPDGTFFPGADDNGSGTVAVIELAKAFAEAKKNGKGPRRSILFIAFAAEERGLLGSAYYAENPIIPLTNTVACINIDMIGRIDDKHLNGNHQYIHVIGVNKLSTELKPIVESANQKTALKLDYEYDRPDEPMRLYYRSDHYNFAKKGIPSLFFFSGLHPHYHTTEDTVDKINFPMMVKREHLIFNTIWEIGNRTKRLAVDIPLK